jgi:hypothetical protein
MRRSFHHLATLTLALGLGTGWAQAQSSRSSRPPLERPPSWEPANTSAGGVYSGRGTSKIPDPTIFDGTDYPEEERPETAMIAQFEMPGAEPDSSQKNAKGPGKKPGGGGQGPGGDGPQMSAGVSIPGMPPLMGGGMAGTDQAGTPPLIPESQMGDPNASGDSGEPGEPGEGGEGAEGAGGEQGEPGNGSPEAPTVAADQQGRQLERPEEMQIGDDDAVLAETSIPTSEASASLQNERGEARMGIEAASGKQSANKSKGTERGVDIPSNL